MQFRAVKGTNDILPDEVRRWQRVEQTFRNAMALGGFSEVRTPILEHKELFVRSTGETSEVVEKQMFELERSGDTYVLRPEGTPGAARAYLMNSVQAQEPVSRWYYIGAMFRAEQPQRGRYRQFHQAGCELYGDASPACDAELLDLLYGFLSRLGITDVTVAVNSIGGLESRAAYRAALTEHLRPRAESLSDHAKKRLEDNPLRISDSKDPRDKAAVADAPSILDSLTAEDREHWQAVLRGLDALGTPYQVTPGLVRGLDYYTRTVFEFQSTMGGLGSQNTLIAGGRYDNMLKSLGGPQIPAIGCGMGLERILLALGDDKVPTPAPCFIAPLGEKATLSALKLTRELRDQGIVTVLDGRGNSMKSMLRRADGLGARVCVVIGESEVLQDQVQIKDLSAAGRMLISVAAARFLLRKVGPGTYPRSGRVHLRLWLAEQIQDLAGAISLASAPWVPYYARALGAKIGNNVQLHSLPPVTGLLSLGSGSNVEPEVDLSGWWIDGDIVHIGAVRIGAGASVGARSTLMPGASIGAGAQVEPGSAVLGKVKAGQHVAGSPAERRGKAKHSLPDTPVEHRLIGRLWFAGFAVASAALALIPYISAGAAVLVVFGFIKGSESLSAAVPQLLLSLAPAALVWFVVNLLLILATTRLLGIGLKEGYYRVRSRIGWQVWATERVLDLARDLLFPIYASLFTPVWLRLLGAKIGKNVEASTVLLIPKMTTVGEGAFLADDTMVASYELDGGWLRIAPAKIGKRSFLGNSGMTAAGRNVPKNSLVAVLSATPAKAKSGTSWLGSPPVRLRRTAIASDDTRTFQPPLRLKVARGLWELGRFVPVMTTVSIAAAVMLAFDWLAATYNYGIAAALGGVVMLLAGAAAAGSAVIAKWVLVGRIRAGEHPLWSSFIWRNEVVDTFIEMVSAPWFARAATGTPALVWWLRALGARIGRGTWCESYWLPEADLVSLGRNSTVNRGCVVQTHLFHDRVMSLDTVTLEDGATMGPHGVILPQASIGSGGTVGPASLVMRGESVPAATYWMGNPVSPWSGPAAAAPKPR